MDKQTVELCIKELAEMLEDTNNQNVYNRVFKGVCESWLALHAELERLQAEAAAMRQALKNKAWEKAPHSFTVLDWACGHTGSAVCKQCADKWVEERDQLRRLAEAVGDCLSHYSNRVSVDLEEAYEAWKGARR